MSNAGTRARGHRVNVVKHHLRSEQEERLFAQDGCMLTVTDALVRAIEAAGLTRAQVAERIGRTPAFVSQVLNGSRNMTLKTAADILWACGLELRDVETAPIGEVVVSRECMDAWLDQQRAAVTILHARRHSHVDTAFGAGSYWVRLTAEKQHTAPVRFGVRSAEAGATDDRARADGRAVLAAVG